MVTDKLKELEATRAKMADLEKSIAAELNRELGSLPAKYGFDSMQSLIVALKAAGGSGAGAARKSRGPQKAAAPAGKTRGGKRRQRAVITDATRSELKKLVDQGKTGNEIAKSLGISLPSVQNIKKALGLVRKGKK